MGEVLTDKAEPGEADWSLALVSGRGLQRPGNSKRRTTPREAEMDQERLTEQRGCVKLMGEINAVRKYRGLTRSGVCFGE